MLACIAFSCPNLEFMEILKSDTAINRINGYNSCSLFVFLGEIIGLSCIMHNVIYTANLKISLEV